MKWMRDFFYEWKRKNRNSIFLPSTHITLTSNCEQFMIEGRQKEIGNKKNWMIFFYISEVTVGGSLEWLFDKTLRNKLSIFILDIQKSSSDYVYPTILSTDLQSISDEFLHPHFQCNIYKFLRFIDLFWAPTVVHY